MPRFIMFFRPLADVWGNDGDPCEDSVLIYYSGTSLVIVTDVLRVDL